MNFVDFGIWHLLVQNSLNILGFAEFSVDILLSQQFKIQNFASRFRLIRLHNFEKIRKVDMPFSLNAEELKKYQPNRYPFLMIDRIEEVEPGKYAKGYTVVVLNNGRNTSRFLMGRLQVCQFRWRSISRGAMVYLLDDVS